MWAADWKDTSYWLDDMPQVSGVSSDLKRKVDVLIIGSGYTGLNAALEIASSTRPPILRILACIFSKSLSNSDSIC